MHLVGKPQSVQLNVCHKNSKTRSELNQPSGQIDNVGLRSRFRGNYGGDGL